MSKYNIIWTEFAEWNLDQVYYYVLRESFSERIAKKFILKLISRVEQLERFPRSGKIEPFLTGLGKEFRFLVYNDYKIIYYVEDNKIYVADVFHTKLSPVKMKKRYQ